MTDKAQRVQVIDELDAIELLDTDPAQTLEHETYELLLWAVRSLREGHTDTNDVVPAAVSILRALYDRDRGVQTAAGVWAGAAAIAAGSTLIGTAQGDAKP